MHLLSFFFCFTWEAAEFDGKQKKCKQHFGKDPQQHFSSLRLPLDEQPPPATLQSARKNKSAITSKLPLQAPINHQLMSPFRRHQIHTTNTSLCCAPHDRQKRHHCCPTPNVTPTSFCISSAKKQKSLPSSLHPTPEILEFTSSTDHVKLLILLLLSSYFISILGCPPIAVSTFQFCFSPSFFLPPGKSEATTLNAAW